MKKQSDELKAVIYARYSSHSQTEQSIEGQLHDGYAFAEKCGYKVIGEYIDRALTGKTDERPAFQRLMKDAEKRQFQIVIVWKLDRFARNRYDSAIYKRHLKKYGVRVVSVMENITDSPEGIILEGLLEAMAEYYSANLAENIRRGQQESVKKGWFCGGPIPMGYKLQDRKLVPDDRTAPLIRELYQRYADGETLASIAEDFNQRGFRTSRGRIFKTGTFDRIVPNTAYIGEYVYAGQPVPGLAEPLIDKELYDRAVQRRNANKRAPAAHRTRVNFILQGKLFCGACGFPMSGSCGTSKSGDRHYYYICTGKKRKHDCRKKAEKKDFLEWYVCEQTQQYILDPDRLDYIAGVVADLYNSEIDDSRLKDLERTIQRLDDELNALVDKLIIVPKESAGRIADKMQQLERQRIDAETDLSKLRIQQKIAIKKEEVAAWLRTFAMGDLFDMEFRTRVIDTFINSVYIWDDKIVIFYNIKEGRETIALDPNSELDELKEPGNGGCSPLPGSGGALLPKDEHRYCVFVSGMLGLVVFRKDP